MTNEEERVWRYLLNNRQADAKDVALNCDVSEFYAQRLINRISSENWRTPANVWPHNAAPLEGRKDDQGKPRYDLIPPEIEDAIAMVLTYGAEKYDERNWEKGMNWGRPFAAMRRHMNAWWAGEDKDPETGMSHLWHASCCLAFLVAYEARSIGNDNRNKIGVFADAGMAPEKSVDTEIA